MYRVKSIRKTAVRFLSVGTVFLFSAINVVAQPPTNAQQRLMNLKAVDLAEEYELCATLCDKSLSYRFGKMFDNDQVKVFCDVFNNSTFSADIPVKEYMEIFRKDCRNPVVEIKNIRRKSLTGEQGGWVYTLEFDKLLSYTDCNDVLFPYEENSLPPFHMEMEIFFPADNSSPRITGLRCTNSSVCKKPSRGYIVQKNITPSDAVRDEQVKIGGKQLHFNSLKQAYAPLDQIEYWDSDVRLKAVPLATTPLYDLVQLQYTTKRLRLRARVGYAPFSAYQFSSSTDFTEQTSSAFEAGADFGYSFSLGRVVKIAAYTGLGVSFSRFSLVTGPASYMYDTTDDEGVVYSRQYQVSQASQGVKFTDLFVPLYADFDFRLGKVVSLFLDAGFKIYFNTAAQVEPFHITADVSGKYGDKIITTGGQAFGHIDSDYNEFLSAVSFRRNPVDVTVFANLGCDINLYDNIIFLEPKIGYEYGLTNSYSSSETKFFDSAGGLYPIVYSGSLKKNVVTRPLADCVSFKRSALWFSLGVMFKF